jgi:hypothetical protein
MLRVLNIVPNRAIGRSENPGVGAVTHLVLNTYGPRTFGPPQLVPNTLIGPSGQTVPNYFSPLGQMVPQNLLPMDKWSPTNLVPMDKWSLEYSFRPIGQAVGIQKYRDQIGWGPFVQGDQILGDHLSRGTKFFGTLLSIGTEFDGDHLSRGINLMGIVCPGGQEVGDRKSGDQMGSGPNASQPGGAVAICEA